MKQNKIDRYVCSIWFFVPVLSLLRLSQPIIQISIRQVMFTCMPLPVKAYNGFQLLLCRYLINGYNSIVTDMSNPGFDMLKIMIALQLICDVILISTCLREWRTKQTSRIFLRLRGMLSIGYVLTAFAIYRFVPVCGNYLKKDGLSYIFYDYQYELEKNILFSIGIVVLFMVTWLFFRTKSIYRFICYFWFFVPVLSLVILMQPVIEIGVEDDEEPVYSLMMEEEEEEDIELTTEVKYNQFQLLLYGSLTNVYKDTVVDRKDVEFVDIKIMIAFQLLFDAIIVFIGLWEWRKKQSPMFLLCLRGILTMGYVLIAFTIYRFVGTWIELLHYIPHSYLPRASYVSWSYCGVSYIVSFSIGVVVLFMITWLFFWKEKAIKIRRKKCVNRKDDLHDTE